MTVMSWFAQFRALVKKNVLLKVCGHLVTLFFSARVQLAWSVF